MKLLLTLPSVRLLFILRITRPVSAAESTSFVFNGFQENNISLNGVAEIHDRLIKLTNASYHFGHAFYSSPLLMRGSNAHTVSSFSTIFVFCISPMDRKQKLGGHGMAFVMAPSMSLDGAFPSQFLGLLNLINNNSSHIHLFAVEFDTVKNHRFADIDDNHVGVNVNSMVSAHAEKAGYWTTQSNASYEKFKTEIKLKSEKVIQGWIDYDGHSQVLNVSIAPVGSAHPSIPLISVNLDLWDVFEEQMYVGVTPQRGGSLGHTSAAHMELQQQWRGTKLGFIIATISVFISSSFLDNRVQNRNQLYECDSVVRCLQSCRLAPVHEEPEGGSGRLGA
ncbi:hypothetical protein L7F22_033475 [Adiantum nelumboides]|nr:hypothetical protein [Adiantum nelumboides]